MPPTTLTSKKSTEAARTRDGIRGACQEDLFALCSLLYRDMPVKMTRTFHMPVCEWLQRTPMSKRLIMLPRGHYKTGTFNIALNIQRLLVNPQTRILIASNKTDNAEAMLAEMKAMLNNEILLWAFPDILVKDPERNATRWTSGSITVRRKRQSKEATVETTGMESEITSKHYDHATYDDLVGEKNSQTRDMLVSTREWWQKSQGLLEPHATQDLIGTPWHYDDLYGWMKAQVKRRLMNVAIYERACWYDPDGTVPATPSPRTVVSFPERWSLDLLLEKKRDQGSSVFAAQYLLDPIDDETAVFPRRKAQILPRAKLPRPEDLWVIMTVDPATSQNKWADYSAIAVVGFDVMSRMVVLDLRRGRWSEAEVMAQMFACYKRFPMIRAIGFETTAFQKIYRLLLTSEGEKRGQYLPVVKLERDTKVTKTTRIRALQPAWENGELFLCDDLEALDDFLDEAERFRLYRESTHDDMLDALADTLQLRMQPEEQRTAPLIEDAEVAERAALEDAVQDDRKARGLPPLDLGSMREAVRMQRRASILAQEQQMAMSESEFSG